MSFLVKPQSLEENFSILYYGCHGIDVCMRFCIGD